MMSKCGQYKKSRYTALGDTHMKETGVLAEKLELNA